MRFVGLSLIILEVPLLSAFETGPEGSYIIYIYIYIYIYMCVCVCVCVYVCIINL